MAVVLIPILIVGSGLLVLTVFILRSVLRPRRIESIQELLRQGKAPLAARAARSLLSRDSRNVDARFLLAQALETDGKADLALEEIETINKAGRFGEHATEAAFRRAAARLYRENGRLDEALKEHLLLARMEPQAVEHYLSCGELFEQRNSSDKALKCYMKAARLDESNATAHARLGHLLYRENRKADARGELEAALKLDPDHAPSWFYLGKAKRDTGDFAGALAAFERAQKSQDLKKRALVERGGTYMSMKNPERAIVELERAVRLPGAPADTETLYARYFLSLAYEQTRQLDKAIGQWEMIERAKPGFESVGGKLKQYEQLRTDDRVKDYVTVGRDDFLALCRKAVGTMGLTVGETAEIPNGCEVIATETEGKWHNVRKMPRLIWFLRIPETIGDQAVRAMAEQMRKARIARGAIYASSGFSRSAQVFAESRPIELHGPQRLQRVLAGEAVDGT